MNRLTKTNIHKKVMVAAMTKALGNVSLACKEAGIARVTHYEWMNVDPKYRAEIENISEMAIDYVESKLMKMIEGGDTTAAIFYLKTKGKSRGYVERQEHQLSIAPQPIQYLDVSNYKEVEE